MTNDYMYNKQLCPKHNKQVSSFYKMYNTLCVSNAPISVEHVKLVGNIHLSICYFINLVTTTSPKRLGGIS